MLVPTVLKVPIGAKGAERRAFGTGSIFRTDNVSTRTCSTRTFSTSTFSTHLHL